MADYVPKLQPQLNNGSKTGGEDCGPRSSCMGADWATEGALLTPIPEFRRRARRPAGDTNTEQLTNALRSYDTPKETNGRTDIQAFRKLRQPKSTLREAITDGKYVVVQMSYAVLQRIAPGWDACPTFHGMHSIGVMGQRVREGSVQWRVFDPLADGRRKGIPTGPDWWPRWVVEGVAEGFTKTDGTFSGVVINATRAAK